MAQPCQLIAQLPDLDGALDHSGIEPRIVVMQPLDEPRTLDPPLDPREQDLEMERFEDDVVCARLIGLHRVRWLRLAGDQHDRQISPDDVITDETGKFGTRDARHVKLGKNKVDRSSMKFRHCGLAGVGSRDAEVRIDKTTGDHTKIGLVRTDHEDAWPIVPFQQPCVANFHRRQV